METMQLGVDLWVIGGLLIAAFFLLAVLSDVRK